jgi:hypothetical protein
VFLFARSGPGGWVALAGAAATFATLFVPGGGRAVVSASTDTDVTAPSASSTRSTSRLGMTATFVAAAGLLLSGGTHVVVAPEHFGEWWLYGTFFVGLATVQTAGAVAAVVRPSRRLWLGLVVVSLATIALWAVTRTVGLPFGPEPGEAETAGPLDILASIAEVATAGAAVIVLRTSRVAQRHLDR